MINSDGHRPTRDQIVIMRRYMLLYLKQLLIKSSGTQEEELQAILNYLHTVHEVIHRFGFQEIIFLALG